MLLTTWRQKELPARAPPLPSEALVALAGVAFAGNMPGVAACLLVGYHCMLRTVEAFDAAPRQIVLGQDGTGVMSLRITKAGQRRVSASGPLFFSREA